MKQDWLQEATIKIGQGNIKGITGCNMQPVGFRSASKTFRPGFLQMFPAKNDPSHQWTALGELLHLLTFHVFWGAPSLSIRASVECVVDRHLYSLLQGLRKMPTVQIQSSNKSQNLSALMKRKRQCFVLLCNMHPNFCCMWSLRHISTHGSFYL